MSFVNTEFPFPVFTPYFLLLLLWLRCSDQRWIETVRPNILALLHEILSGGISCLALLHIGILLDSEFRGAVSLRHRWSEPGTLTILESTCSLPRASTGSCKDYRKEEWAPRVVTFRSICTVCATEAFQLETVMDFTVFSRKVLFFLDKLFETLMK